MIGRELTWEDLERALSQAARDGAAFVWELRSSGGGSCFGSARGLSRQGRMGRSRETGLDESGGSEQ